MLHNIIFIKTALSQHKNITGHNKIRPDICAVEKTEECGRQGLEFPQSPIRSAYRVYPFSVV